MRRWKFSRTVFFGTMALLILCARCQSHEKELVTGNLFIAPKPAQMVPHDGYFHINQDTWLKADTFTSGYDPYEVFLDLFERKSGYPLKQANGTTTKADPKNLILVVHSSTIQEKEGYRLTIKPFGIIISASTAQGVFYAMQTLRQIMRIDAMPDVEGHERQWAVPSADVFDQPEFSYRGMHLDVCRHFMPVDFVKKYIDLLAYYKMNYFHWHLTDDQGWRIEIKKYPKLQEVAAYRNETLVGHYSDQPVRYDGQRYGGYYTQEEIKDIVSFAAKRGVTVIPEIEMPGHSRAALAAYPELACTPGPFEVATTWGVFDDVFCPSEVTFAFLEDVLDEVCELFPSSYIHIGGDECPKTRWKESEFCQQLMQEKKLKDEHELQSYFIQRIEKYLNSKGKNIIGWDEILEGGLAPNATVMSWRGIAGGIEAAKQSHTVIMTPGTHCYFDYYQADPASEPLAIGGYIPLEKVYGFEPVPNELTKEEAKFILGGQANLWTEYIATTEQAEYMSYPRAIALAEALWTPHNKKDWKEFVLRLEKHFDRLEGMNVNFANHLRQPSVEFISDTAGLKVTWSTYIPKQTLFFTQDTTQTTWSATMTGDTILLKERGDYYYKTDVSEVYQFRYNPSKSRNAILSSNIAPNTQYPGSAGLRTLQDGLNGNRSFNGKDWCAWRGSDFELKLSFDHPIKVDSVRLGTLSSPGSWILFPAEIEVKASTDGKHFQLMEVWKTHDEQPGRHSITMNLTGKEYSHIILTVLPVMKIKPGQPGAGQPAWTFIDEIEVF